jgi:hypothetical protein
MAAAHAARRQRQRQGKPVPHFVNLIAAAGLVAVCAASAFSFLATFERSEPAANFRVMYACIALLTAGAAIRVGEPALRR